MVLGGAEGFSQQCPLPPVLGLTWQLWSGRGQAFSRLDTKGGPSSGHLGFVGRYQ